MNNKNLFTKSISLNFGELFFLIIIIVGCEPSPKSPSELKEFLIKYSWRIESPPEFSQYDFYQDGHYRYSYHNGIVLKSSHTGKYLTFETCYDIDTDEGTSSIPSLGVEFYTDKSLTTINRYPLYFDLKKKALFDISQPRARYFEDTGGGLLKRAEKPVFNYFEKLDKQIQNEVERLDTNFQYIEVDTLNGFIFYKVVDFIEMVNLPFDGFTNVEMTFWAIVFKDELWQTPKEPNEVGDFFGKEFNNLNLIDQKFYKLPTYLQGLSSNKSLPKKGSCYMLSISLPSNSFETIDKFYLKFKNLENKEILLLFKGSPVIEYDSKSFKQIIGSSLTVDDLKLIPDNARIIGNPELIYELKEKKYGCNGSLDYSFRSWKTISIIDVSLLKRINDVISYIKRENEHYMLPNINLY